MSAAPVIDMLFPQGTPSRVPIAAITGTNGKTTTSRMLAHIAKMAGYTPGLTTTDGVYIDGQRTVEGDMTGPVSARMVLRDPQIDLAVLETARGGLLRAGMGVREVNVGAVLNVASDHLGLKGIDTLEQLAEVKRIVVEVAQRLRGAQCRRPERAADVAPTPTPRSICYVTMNPCHALVREHIRAGGRACALEAGVNGHMITLVRQGQPHSADVDASDSGNTRRPRTAQCAERDVRRGDGASRWASSSTRSATACAPSTRPSSRRRDE